MPHELLLVRHGQAGSASANYDQLSDLGRRQSRRLGDWLVAHHPEGFEHVVCGALVRHKETLDPIQDAFSEAGIALPAVEYVPGLNEFDHHAVIAAYARRQGLDDSMRAMRNGEAHDPAAVYRFLRAALGAWAACELEADLAEGWQAFTARIAAATAQLHELSRTGGAVLVVTSGGVIAQFARLALNLEPRKAVEMNLSVRNSSISEFRAYQGDLSMQSWNTLPHLHAPDDRALWTYY